jgi:hypothetical protein
VRILRSPDRRWRVEEHRDGWRLYDHNFLMLTRATLDQVVNHMLDAGADPEELQER